MDLSVKKAEGRAYASAAKSPAGAKVTSRSVPRDGIPQVPARTSDAVAAAGTEGTHASAAEPKWTEPPATIKGRDVYADNVHSALTRLAAATGGVERAVEELEAARTGAGGSRGSNDNGSGSKGSGGDASEPQKFRGTEKRADGWHAHVQIVYKKYSSGPYRTEHEAAEAYDALVWQYCPVGQLSRHKFNLGDRFNCLTLSQPVAQPVRISDPTPGHRKVWPCGHCSEARVAEEELECSCPICPKKVNPHSLAQSALRTRTI